jgi:hypothetical protein
MGYGLPTHYRWIQGGLEHDEESELTGDFFLKPGKYLPMDSLLIGHRGGCLSNKGARAPD